MKLEEFINEILCPTGTVTAWDETVICMAIRLGDMDKLTDQLAIMCKRAGVPIPTDLTLPDVEQQKPSKTK